MPNLPDSTELFRVGLDPDKSYLRSPKTVEDQIRILLSKVVDIRGRQLKEEELDAEAELRKLAEGFQSIFYGKDAAFAPDPRWNRPEMLGYVITDVAGLGGDREDAVERLAARIINEFLDLYLQFEDGAMDDETFQFQCDALIEPYVYIMLGLPAPD